MCLGINARHVLGISEPDPFFCPVLQQQQCNYISDDNRSHGTKQNACCGGKVPLFR